MKCDSCNANVEEKAICPACAERLRQLNRDLAGELQLQKSWVRTFWNAKKKAEAELERVKGELRE